MRRTIKFRVWDGEQMISPDYINRQGYGCWKSNIIPETTNRLMQYVGLNDKNGKEIFEGDIISFTKHKGVIVDSFVAPVSFEDGSFGYQQTYFIPFTDWGELHNDCLKWLEVIGNIYENKNLLV